MKNGIIQSIELLKDPLCPKDALAAGCRDKIRFITAGVTGRAIESSPTARRARGPMMATKTCRLIGLVGALALAVTCTRGLAADFTVTNAQQLHDALTAAAGNGADNTIYLAPGRYSGNLNISSTKSGNLTLLPEPGVTNTQIIMDPMSSGPSLTLSSATPTNTITVRGMTFLRDCGSPSTAALTIAGGPGSTLLMDSCLFLTPTNAGAAGMGLAITSGQDASLTNCAAIGSSAGIDTGVSINVSGNVTAGGCTFATNGGGALSVSAGSSVTIAANTFSGNFPAGNQMNDYGAATVTANGSVAFANNSLIGNGGRGDASLTGGNITIAGNSCADLGVLGFFVTCGATCLLSNNVVNGGGATWLETGGSQTAMLIISNSLTGTAGVYAEGSLACVVAGNKFADSAGGAYGTLYCNGCQYSVITNNTFTGNSWALAGAVCCVGAGSSNFVCYNTFVANIGAQQGGAVSLAGATDVCSGNIFLHNSGGQAGGAIYATSGSITLADNLIVSNTASSGGGIYVNPGANAYVINNTVFGNAATAGDGGGAFFQMGGSTENLLIYNNIIWGNTASGAGADLYRGGNSLVNDLLFNDVHDYYNVWTLQSNLDADPQFADPTNGNYHLQSTSPCIGAGTVNAPSLPATDLAGNPRVVGGMVDLGCYETGAPTGLKPQITANPQNAVVPLGGATNFSVAATGAPPLRYQWLFDGTNLADTARITGSQGNVLSITGVLMSDAGNYACTVSNIDGAVTSATATLAIASTTTYTESLDLSSNQPPAGWTLRTAYGGGAITGGRVYAYMTDGLAYLSKPLAFPGRIAQVKLEWTGYLCPSYWGIHYCGFIDLASGDSCDGSSECKGCWWGNDQVTYIGDNCQMCIHGPGTGGPYSEVPVETGVFRHSLVLDNGQATFTINNTADGSLYNSFTTNAAWLDPSLATNVTFLAGTSTTTNAWMQDLFLEIQFAGTGAPPTIITNPATVVVPVGGTATFTVTATGAPPPSYQWYFNGSAISSATNASFTVPDATAAWVGGYSVKVSNSVATTNSATAGLWLDTVKMYAGVNVYGPVGSTNCLVQYTTNLTAPVAWMPLVENLTIVTNPTVIIDYDSPGQPQRFYQVVPGQP